MTILLHEQPFEVDERVTVMALREQVKPDADVVISNGAIVTTDRALAEGDEVHFIRRGEVPSAEDMEALLTARHTPGVHAAVKAGTVGIAGLGGLGSTIAMALARTGVGSLVCADFDVVEPSNLNRQQYTVAHIGLPKTTALGRTLAEINPYVKVTMRTVKLEEGNVIETFDGVDVMVEAFDSTAAKTMLLRVWRDRRPETPLVMASGLAGYGSANTIRTRRVLDNLYLVGDEESEARPGMGLMAPRVGVAACHQANAVLRLLLGLPVGE